MTEIGTIIDGKYEVLKEIGRGGMSTVYLAMDRRLNKQWAVKEIRKKGTGANDEIVVNSLLAEANLMKRLDHPALPRIVDIIDNGVTIYVIMDYIEGESLDKILKEFGVQDEELVIEWAKQICDALSYLHSQKPRPIVYRDMKPANIMLKPEGNIKIIDFGIAREYKEQNLSDTKVLGTRGFAPPEAYNGQTTPRSDIYSLGMTMHNLLTGVDPRMGDGYVPVRQINPNLSEGIELIIDKCVQPAEENRYQSCADLLYDLEHPDLITSGYKKKQKRKIIGTVIPFVLSIIMAISGIGTALVANEANSHRYDQLVEALSRKEGDNEIMLTDAEKLANYKKAIKLYPGKIEAYEKVYGVFEEKKKNGISEEDKAHIDEAFAKFKIKPDDFVEAVYFDGDNKDYYLGEVDEITADLSSEEKKEFLQNMANLNYKVGKMLYFYYKPSTDDGGSGADSEKYRVARDYFAINEAWVKDGFVAEYEKQEECEALYDICNFFYCVEFQPDISEKIGDPFYVDFMDSLNICFDLIEESDAEALEKMMWCNNVMVVLDKKELIEDLEMSGVNLNELDALVENIYTLSQECLVRNTNGPAKELQESITEYYNGYKVIRDDMEKGV